MKFIFWVIVTQGLFLETLAFYHMESRKDFIPPRTLQNDSFFGYSITFDSQHQELVISSPRENDIGEVYKCDIHQRHNCTPFLKPSTLTNRESQNYTHDYWFGATVKAGYNFVVMCAPRFTEKYLNQTAAMLKNVTIKKEYGTYGKCYTTKWGNLSTLGSIDIDERNKNSPYPFEATMDSFGWSIDVASDDSIAVGGPGMFKGRVMIYMQGREDPDFIRLKLTQRTLNFGYSVVFGTFINQTLSYAVGSPYGENGEGQVLFYHNILYLGELDKTADPGVMGSMFGAVLCAAKLLGERSDLLVGAPTYSPERYTAYNTGAVYIYIAKTIGIPPVYRRTIKGRVDGAMFGSAIVSLGDLNGDKKDEVAISAPFENKGAVYIYSGVDLVSDETGQALMPFQKLEPEPASVFQTSFGWSLTPLLDYDENGCNELAVGAPFSDAVAVYHCITAITVKLNATFPNLQNRNKSETVFEFEVCLSTQYPSSSKNLIADLSTQVQMTHDFANLTNAFDGIYTFNTSLNEKNQDYCTNVEFNLPLVGNYDVEILYKISTILINDPRQQTTFNSSRVILNDLSVLTLQDSVWATQCSSKECVPRLNLTIISSMKDVYQMGSSDTEEFSLALYNSGDPAFDPYIYIHIVGAMVLKKSNDCVSNSTNEGETLKCIRRKPLKTNSTWVIDKMFLQMTELTNLIPNITLKIFVFNSCKDSNYSLTNTRVTKLIPDPKGVTVEGKTNIGNNVNMRNEDIQHSGKHMEHVYTIMNSGSTNWAGLTARIKLQKKTYISYSEKPVSMYVENKNIVQSYCHLSQDNELEYKCKIDYLKQHIVTIIVPIYVLPGRLEGVLDENKNVTTATQLLLVLKGAEITNITKCIVTTISYEKVTAVSIWVIIAAVLLGFIILCIIGFILYKCGFLRRKNKEELKQLEESVKRRSMMRSGPMMEIPAKNEERTKVLESMNEEKEDIVIESDGKQSS